MTMPATTVISIRRSEAGYLDALATYLGDHAPERIYALGNVDLLQQKSFALFCSVKCPGELILKTYDLACALRDDRITVISGFHSPMERECLSLLLRGKQPVIWCLARRLISRRLTKEYAESLSSGRLLILSSFKEGIGHATEDTAHIRNEFVAALADRIFVVHAFPGGGRDGLCRKALTRGKPLLTFNSPDNAALLTMGARPYSSFSSLFPTRHR